MFEIINYIYNYPYNSIYKYAYDHRDNYVIHTFISFIIYFYVNIMIKNVLPFCLKILFITMYILIKISSLNYYFHKMMVWMDRYRIINDRQDSEPYLLRYYLFIKNRNIFPFNIFLHKFLKSDPDDLHDHPWPFITIILYGGYWEHTVDGKKTWWGAGTFRYASADTLHRISIDPNYPDIWTLFIPGPKQREWGFKTEKGWINNFQYLVDKKK